MRTHPVRRSLNPISLLSAAVLMTALSAPLAAQTPHTDLGERVGDFALLDQQGYFHHMSWYDNRKAVVLLVQANGSAAFNQALPAFQTLHAQHQDAFQFFMLNPLGQTRASVIAAVGAASDSIPVLIDDAQLISEAMGVIVVAATNRPDILDAALLRPGRFDRQVYVTLPDIRGREQILNVHMRKIPVGQDVAPAIIARGTPGMSGADLANLCNEAALMAARRNARVVEMQDFEKAKDKILMGPERKSMVMPEEERKNTAYHESGHALIGKLLPKCDPVHKVTIIPRGRALGVTMSLPAQDRYSYDSEYMLNQISMLFGGRIAEEVFMNQMTTGASNDFERATHIARDMVTRYGMTDALGPMVYAENEGEVFLGRSVTKTTNMSEQTMQKVDAEVRRIIDQQYSLARKLIEDNQDKMHAMAKALLEWETIDSEQLDDIMAGKEPRAPKDWTPRTPNSDGGNGSGGSPAVKTDPTPTAA